MTDKSVKVKQCPDTGNCYLDIHEILEGTNVNPEDVVFYHMETEGEQIKVLFFDKDKNPLKVEIKEKK